MWKDIIYYNNHLKCTVSGQSDYNTCRLGFSTLFYLLCLASYISADQEKMCKGCTTCRIYIFLHWIPILGHIKCRHYCGQEMRLKGTHIWMVVNEQQTFSLHIRVTLKWVSVIWKLLTRRVLLLIILGCIYILLQNA